MRRAVSDALISMGALAVLLLALVSVDDRVRERITNMLAAPPSSAQIVGAGETIREVSAIVVSAARDQSIEHAPLMIFAAAATVLVLFMVRT
jgi:hypothetical protein